MNVAWLIVMCDVGSSYVQVFASVLSASAAVIAALVGLFGILNAKRQIDATLAIAEKQLKATVVTANRQRWIDRLRNEVASLLGTFTRIGLALAYEPNARPPTAELHGHLQDATRIMGRIELLLNPTEPDSKALLDLIQGAERDVQKFFDGKVEAQRFINDSGVSRNAIVGACQRILKTEWERVKALE